MLKTSSFPSEEMFARANTSVVFADRFTLKREEEAPAAAMAKPAAFRS